jgi:hypothetical protein
VSTKHESWGMSYCTTFRQFAEVAAANAVADLENRSLAKHRGRDGSTMTYTPHAIQAVLMSVMALEAGINEVETWIGSGFAGPPRSFGADFKRKLPLHEKWSTLPRQFAGTDFDRSARPWQDFRTLIALRDSIVHFKWRDAKVPKFMRALQSWDLTIPAAPGIYWFDAAMTDRVATWATATCDSMFEGLAALLGRSGDDLWPWQ